jgi:hypothetical protein
MVMGTLLLHMHIPKCAGTTVEEHFKAELGDKGFWKPIKRTRKFPLELFSYKYDPKLPGPSEQVRAVSSHFVGKSIAEKFPDRRIVRSIILREPESLMLSWYNFRIMRYMLKGQNPYSFSLFMRSMRMNQIAHFLLLRWGELPWLRVAQMSDAMKAAALDDILSTFDHVVDISEADRLIATLSPQIGIQARAPRRNTADEKQKKTGWKVVGLEDLNPQDRELLRTRTSLDRYLWRRWVLKQDVTFDASQPSGFLYSELVRPGYQIRRRATRRFGLP